MKKGTLLIDSSTIDPAVSREMAVAAEKMGAVFMDAPVSGGNPPKERNVFLILCSLMIAICKLSFCFDTMASIQYIQYSQWMIFIVRDSKDL